jgi:hypothetical protein
MSVAGYERDGYRLAFFAVPHILHYPGIAVEVRASIDGELRRRAPEAVVVEGYPRGPFTCQDAIYVFAKPQARRSESDYLARAHVLAGKFVYGAEPREIAIPSPDREGFLLLQNIASLQRS